MLCGFQERSASTVGSFGDVECGLLSSEKSCLGILSFWGDSFKFREPWPLDNIKLETLKEMRANRKPEDLEIDYGKSLGLIL